MRGADDGRVLATYREFVPRDELRPYVRAFFSFVPGDGSVVHERRVLRDARFTAGDSFCSPLFAAGTASIVFQFGPSCSEHGGWLPSRLPPDGQLLGPVSRAGGSLDARRRIMLGAYLHPVATAPLAPVASSALVDRAIALTDLWTGAGASELAAELVDLGELERIGRLEDELVRRTRDWRPRGRAIDVRRLATYVQRTGGRHSVDTLARLSGESRQSLTRTFRHVVGVPPKLFSRLARFQAALSYIASSRNVGWARAAVELGFADQAHMIAELKAFSGLTPQRLVSGRWFHPFIQHDGAEASQV